MKLTNKTVMSSTPRSGKNALLMMLMLLFISMSTSIGAIDIASKQITIDNKVSIPSWPPINMIGALQEGDQRTAVEDKQYLPLVIKDHTKKFTVTIPYRMDAMSYALTPNNVDVDATRGIESAYALRTDIQQKDSLSISIEVRKNVPTDGTTLDVWNTTWYGVPVEGMRNEDFLRIWKDNTKNEHITLLDGGLLRGKDVLNAYWGDMVINPKGTEVKGVKEPTGEPQRHALVSSFIMRQEPTLEYAVEVYASGTQATEAKNILLSHIIPSFAILDEKYEPAGTVPLKVGDNTYSVIVPPDFKPASVKEGLQYRGAGMVWEINVFPVQDMLWFNARGFVPERILSLMSDQHFAALSDPKSNAKASFDGYYALYENNQLGFVMYGTMFSKTLGRRSPVVIYGHMTPQHEYIVSRIFYDEKKQDSLDKAIQIATGVRDASPRDSSPRNNK